MGTNGIDKPRKLKRRSPQAIRRCVLNALVSGLSDQEKMFCEEYIKHFNGTRAYQKIKPEVSYGAAGVTSHKWLKRSRIQQYISLLVERISEENHLVADRVMKEVATLAFSNMLDFSKWGRTWLKIKPSSRMSRMEGACIKKIKRTETKHGDVNIEFELYDKYKGLNMLAQYFALLKPELDDEDASQRAINLRQALEGMFSSVPLLPAHGKEEVSSEQ